MEEQLTKLHQYLYSNNHRNEADTISIILEEYKNTGSISERNKDLLIEMCHPKFLGDLYVREYESSYDWWKFLDDIRTSLYE